MWHEISKYRRLYICALKLSRYAWHMPSTIGYFLLANLCSKLQTRFMKKLTLSLFLKFLKWMLYFCKMVIFYYTSLRPWWGIPKYCKNNCIGFVWKWKVWIWALHDTTTIILSLYETYGTSDDNSIYIFLPCSVNHNTEYVTRNDQKIIPKTHVMPFHQKYYVEEMEKKSLASFICRAFISTCIFVCEQ